MKLLWLPIVAAFLALILPVSAFGYYRFWSGGTESPAPSPTPALSPTPTPAPTAIKRAFYDKHIPNNRCSYSISLSEWGWVLEDLVRWSPDGSQILFDWGPEIYAIDAAGGHSRMIVDASWKVLVDGGVRYRRSTRTSWDVSPDGSKLVFSRCGRNPPGEQDYQFLDGDRQSKWVLVGREENGTEHYEPLWIVEAAKHSYQIAVVNMDGTGVEKLSGHIGPADFPSWSPDGNRIAFFAGRALYTMATDGSDMHHLPGAPGSYYLRPPAWSPDGQYVAVVGWGGTGERRTGTVYAVKSDGSEVVTVARDILSPPSWSPDSQRIAVAVPDGSGGADLRTFALDGSTPVTIAEIADSSELPRTPGYEGYGTWLVPNVAWSPDGSKIMYSCGVELCAVNVHDGSLVFESLPVNPGWKSSSSRGPSEVAAAWSPDGSRIAVKLPQWKKPDGAPSLFIMDSDGTNPHVLMTD